MKILAYLLLFMAIPFASLSDVNEDAKQEESGPWTKYSSPAVDDWKENARNAIKEDNYGEALKIIRPQAEAGDARALYVLGQFYEKGLGVPANENEAEKWYEILIEKAKTGDKDAQWGAGEYYYHKSNYDEAIKFYNNSANNNELAGIIKLAEIYYFILKKPKEGLFFIDKSYKIDRDNSIEDISSIFQYSESDEDTKLWAEKLSKDENLDGTYLLGLIYIKSFYVNNNVNDAIKSLNYIKFAAESDHNEAEIKLNEICYLLSLQASNEVMNKNYKKAFSIYNILPNKNLDTSAFNDLGYMYENGFGVEKNLAKAIQYYEQSANSDDSFGYYNLGRLTINTYRENESIDYLIKAYKKGYTSAIDEIKKASKFKDWRQVTTSDDSVYFMYKNIDKGKYKKVWLLTFPFDIANGEKKSLMLFDCTGKTLATTSHIEYDNTGKIVNSWTLKEKEVTFNPIIPETVGDSFYEYACKTPQRKKK